ncbi:2-oxoglutarate-dependent dioxygenase 19-like [Juglans microcarpa x Juglans regia]|uniref:2-oxoglutarate-dependent dioxygenase 19-like n=1 Tax=Juglans microcarpa x Juglans regia TaxID=2249226 RepID=UPI001B7EACB7|nr:2-oxoglutarate-dependent dioxygenase 19-like [Juglans microcarpa x Juglans regia]
MHELDPSRLPRRQVFLFTLYQRPASSIPHNISQSRLSISCSIFQSSSQPLSPIQISRMTCIKKLAESPGLTSIPSLYSYTTNPKDQAVSEDPEDSIPVIDFSILTSGTPHQRSQAIEELGKACKDWGFFLLINHGVPERQMEAVTENIREFFDLTEEEKREFEGKNLLDPIRCGTSFNTSLENVFFWRDFLKILINPDDHEFQFPNKPPGFREVSLDYCKRIREVARELLKAISMSLGLEPCYIEKATNLESGLQVFIANLYPPCPQPELAMGLPPHSDHGLLTLVMQNGIGGLQTRHNGNWVNVNAIPNSFLVNTADQLEILSNGKYKSNVHRAVVNSKATRISLAIANGPSFDTMIRPAPELESKEQAAAYIGMKYKDYMELQQGNQLDGKSCLDRVRAFN